jgi:hypothetical protein
VARTKGKNPTLPELEAECQAWVGHVDARFTYRVATEVAQAPLPNLLRGFFQGISLFPHTKPRPGRFAIYYSRANPLERDWANVGQDLYRAILRYRMADQSSGRDTPESELTDHSCSR